MFWCSDLRGSTTVRDLREFIFFPFGQFSLVANHFGYGCSVNVLLLWPQGFYNCTRFKRVFFFPLDNAHLWLTTLGMGVCSVPWLLWACIGARPLLHQGPCLPAPGHEGAAVTAQWHQGDVCILVCVFNALLIFLCCWIFNFGGDIFVFYSLSKSLFKICMYTSFSAYTFLTFTVW